jgi:hypothetical protein
VRNLLRVALVLSCSGVALPFPAGQVGAQPVGQDSGPLRELSTNVRAGSGPVRGSVGNAPSNAGALRDRSVRGSVTGDVLSGPVSDSSAGAVTAGRPVAGGGSVAEVSVGAVKKDTDRPLGEMISQPLRELGPLQEQLRAIQPLPRNPPLPEEEVAPAEVEPSVRTPDVATEPQEPAAGAGSKAARDETEPEPPLEDDSDEQKSTEVQEAPPPTINAP